MRCYSMQKEQILSFLNTYTDPCYIFDLDELSRRFLMLQQTLGDEITLCYAMKANPFLVAPLLHLSTKYEVCSPGEFAICEKEHIPMDRIVLSGVNKEERELKRVMKTYGSAYTYTVESLHQFYLLKSFDAQSNKTISVLLRLSSGNQFGMDEHTILELLKTWNNSDFLHFPGYPVLFRHTEEKFESSGKGIDASGRFLQTSPAGNTDDSRRIRIWPGILCSLFRKGRRFSR